MLDIYATGERSASSALLHPAQTRRSADPRFLLKERQFIASPPSAKYDSLAGPSPKLARPHTACRIVNMLSSPVVLVDACKVNNVR